MALILLRSWSRFTEGIAREADQFATMHKRPRSIVSESPEGVRLQLHRAAKYCRHSHGRAERDLAMRGVQGQP